MPPVSAPNAGRIRRFPLFTTHGRAIRRPRALTISHLSGVPVKRLPEWKPRWGGDPVKISYRDFSLIGLALPPECTVMK